MGDIVALMEPITIKKISLCCWKCQDTGVVRCFTAHLWPIFDSGCLQSGFFRSVMLIGVEISIFLMQMLSAGDLNLLLIKA